MENITWLDIEMGYKSKETETETETETEEDVIKKNGEIYKLYDYIGGGINNIINTEEVTTS